MEHIHTSHKQDVVQDFFENFDAKLALYIIKKSKTFVLLVLFLCSLLPYLYIRYSVPVYETSAALIKKKESKNKLLDEKTSDLLNSNDEDKINRDIQIIRSDYLLESICDSIGYNITYYRLGRLKFNKFEFLAGPKFKIQPDYRIHNKALWNKNINIELIPNNCFNLKYELPEKTVSIKNIRTNRNFSNRDLSFTLSTTTKDLESFIIIFNDRESIKNQVLRSLNLTNASPNILFNIRSTNPAKSETMLNQVMNGFLREDEKENSEKVENSLTYIRRYIDTLNAQLRISQVEKTNYSVQNNVYAPTEQLTAALEEIRQSKLKIDEANDKIYALENLQKSIQNNSNIQFNLEGNVLSDNELEKMIREKNKLIHDYNASHPFIKELNKNIAERTQSSMQKSKNSIHNEMILYQRKLAEIRSAQSEAKNDLRNLPEKDMEYNKIQKEVEIKEKYVLELLDKQIQYLIFKSSISSDYLVIQQPKTKPEVVSPNKTILYSSGILSFLLLCFLIFFYRYLSFDKIVSLAELKRKTNVPILGYIPFVSEALLEQVSKNAPESRLVVLKNSKSRNAEVFKKMRASLKYTSKGEYKVIASTSTISGEGKTFVLINLAAVHALLDKKVIIIDLDLRKPRISKSFKLDNTLGMSNLLSSSDANLDDHIKKGVILDNLDVITSGPVPPNPSELITSDRFDEILTELKTKYDYIFIDTPPVGLVNESIEIINKADIPLYLVRFNYSRKDFLNTLNETANLKKGNPIYIVINHFGDGASSYVNYDYGGYSSYYGYGANYGYHKKHEGYYTEDSKMKTPSIFELIINFFDWKL